MSDACLIDGCAEVPRSRGLCGRHYKRLLVHGDPTVTLNPRMDGATLAEKMAAYTDRSAGPDECWPWTRGKSSDGYGRVYANGGNAIAAHRVAYEMVHGPIPAGAEIMHSCDNPPCCNPAHLRYGSHAENMAEMSARQRAAKGDRHTEMRVTDAGVRHARWLHSVGMAQQDIAAIFGVSRPFMSRLIRGERR